MNQLLIWLYDSAIVLLALLIGLMLRPMKRAYLFGLGCFLILYTLSHIGWAFWSTDKDPIDPRTGFYMVLTSMLLGVVAFLAAKSAPLHRSRLHAIIGWSIGFFIIEVARAVVAIVYLFVRFDWRIFQ